MSILVPRDDDRLTTLAGAEIPSETSPGVSYRITYTLASGASAVTFAASRVTAGGQCPVALKILRPSFVSQGGSVARLAIKKEAVALSRLNERTPPTPFVVRLIDCGEVGAVMGPQKTALPWMALELVQGGAEGTTLDERIRKSLRRTGYAFHPARAVHAIQCIAKGIDAVHQVDVIHRDIKPPNILCCGAGEDEIFKVADFGIARPSGVATFGAVMMGTPGYVAPEVALPESTPAGPWSDVFAFACVIFSVLTGEHYFTTDSLAAALVATKRSERRSLLDSASLHPDLRAREDACHAIDVLLSRATSFDPGPRPRTAGELATSILAWLRPQEEAPGLSTLLLQSWDADDEETQSQSGWTWLFRKNPAQDLAIRSAAWDSDGRCLAVASTGLLFWNGTEWRPLPKAPDLRHEDVCFARRLGPGSWMVGGEGGVFAVYTADGVREVKRTSEPSMRVELFSGDIGDLAAVAGTIPGKGVFLHGLSGRRWLRPLPLPDVRSVSALERVDDDKWLIGGRDLEGRAYVAVYSPLDWQVTRLPTTHMGAFLSCAGQHDRRTGVAAGTGGVVLHYQSGETAFGAVQDAAEIQAAAVDLHGWVWLASPGRIWFCDKPGSAEYACVLEDPGWKAPIASLFAAPGRLVALAADGSMVEGRAS